MGAVGFEPRVNLFAGNFFVHCDLLFLVFVEYATQLIALSYYTLYNVSRVGYVSAINIVPIYIKAAGTNPKRRVTA